MTNQLEIKFDEEKPLNNGMVFLEVEILSGKTTTKDIKEYKQQLKAYEEEAEQAESLGIPLKIEKPEEPDFDVDYRKQWINLANKTIDCWYSEWDEDKDCEIVIVDYYTDTNEGQFTIKITAKEWMDKLNSFGAVHIK